MRASKAVGIMARVGYGARGIVYLIIGYFALLAALGSGATKDTDDVFQVVLSQPFGMVLLGLLIAGLFAFGGWRMAQSLFDADDHGTDAKGYGIRAAQFISGLIYFALAASALGLTLSWGSGGGDPIGRLIAAAMEQGWGRIALYAIAAIPVGIAIAHFVKAWRCSYEEHFICDSDVLDRVRPVARIGLAARGVAFLIIGGLIFWGGLSYAADKQPGTQAALEALQSAPFGWVLLSLMGAGLIAFAAFCAAQAAYRQVSV